ncbi:hypothetical protein GCM10017783_23620 [Deinococcus piscis]|uniref:ABC transporter permease n=2 Tax=Deinococcus piscis TaxID=394230 RepID=A0ABQ3KA17_9DEIO|nr:hypothetical protein GCM10017783_23620 [Deinococcus piscis]
MLKLLQLEVLKLRRTLVWPAVLGLPLVPAAVNLGWFTATGFRGRDWAEPLGNAQVTWFLLLEPLVLGLLAAQLTGLEGYSGGWRLIFAAPRPRHEGLLPLGLLLLGLSLLMMVIMGGMTALSSALLPLSGTPNWTQFACDLGRGWLASLGLLGLSMWAALRFSNFLVPLGLGAAEILLAFAGLSQPLLSPWWPWSLPILAAQPPDGGSALRLLLISVGLGVAFALLTVREAERREV